MTSIALAAYNGEKYIREQLDSILAQTVTDWELVACDDRSSDGTLTILREYATRDGRIRVYANERNLGFRKNFERAMSLCCGDYIAFSDQDDVWYPDHLDRLLSGLGDCDLVTGNAMLADAGGRETGTTARDTDRIVSVPTAPGESFFTMLYRPYVQGSASLARADFLKGCLPIPDGVRFHDQWFGMMAALSGGVAYVPACVLKYRMHGSNQTDHMRWNSLEKLREAFLGDGNRRIYREQLEFLLALEKYGVPGDRTPDLDRAVLFFRRLTTGRTLAVLPFWIGNYFKIYRSRNPLDFMLRAVRIFIFRR